MFPGGWGKVPGMFSESESSGVTYWKFGRLGWFRRSGSSVEDVLKVKCIAILSVQLLEILKYSVLW